MTEGVPLPAECFDRERNDCAITSICKLRHVLSDAIAAFYSVLDQYTLDDLVHNREALASVLKIKPNRTRDLN